MVLELGRTKARARVKHVQDSPVLEVGGQKQPYIAPLNSTHMASAADAYLPNMKHFKLVSSSPLTLVYTRHRAMILGTCHEGHRS